VGFVLALVSGHGLCQQTDDDALFSRPFVSAPAGGEEADLEFRKLMRTGLTEARKGNLEAAHNAYAEAWKIRADVDLAALLAQTEMKLGRFREAAEHWDFYLNNRPPDRATAELKLAECRKRLGQIHVSADTPGAKVYLDDRELGSAPLQTDVWVDPGVHSLIARLNHESSPERTITIAAGETQGVTLLVTPPSPPAQLQKPLPPPPSPAPANQQADTSGMSPKTIVLISGGVLTAAAIGMGIGFTLKYNAAKQEADRLTPIIASKAMPPYDSPTNYCVPPPGVRPDECTELAQKADERQSAAYVAIGSWVAAGVFAAGTTAAYFLWPAARDKAEHARVEATPLLFGPVRGLAVRVTY
jgi:hypothetical protein